MEKIIIKKSSDNIRKELNSIGFDSSYIDTAKDKYSCETFKIFSLKPHEANILKQICLSLGFDCAVSRDTVTCKCDSTNAIICANFSQYNKLIDKLKSQPFRLRQLSNELDNVINKPVKPIIINNYTFDWSRPYIMGILNVTPNSFSDGGKYINPQDAFNKAVEMVNDGADIIDIGGESTRPNSAPVEPNEEISRIIPVIELIRKNGITTPISVDTRHYETALASLEAGADIINCTDMFADTKLLQFVNNDNIPSILMHSDKIPANSSDYTDKDVVEQVYIDLYNKLSEISAENVIVDVGIGFGKSPDSCYELLNRINEFKSLNKPILSGISRKSFITKKFNISTDDADIPTALYSSILAKNGIQIHRVHNVKLLKDYFNYLF
ncbi:dihydropteroate synthase [bacterium]|nr:dihydropteroate synthase [bacterium]